MAESAATGKIVIETLGHSGVVLDKNPLEPSLPADSLRNAQNAIHDPQAGHGGALRKRDGLRKFSLTSAGDVILGGIPMPVAGTGGAPADSGSNSIPGSGATGTTIGSGGAAGGGTGAPGATFDGGAVTSGSAGASAFGGGTGGVGTIFGGRRLIAFGRIDNTGSVTPGSGWYLTTASFATDTPISKTTPGPPTVDRDIGLIPAVSDDGSIGSLGDKAAVVMPDGWLYYAQQMANTGDVRPPIRRTNGVIDEYVTQIPRNPNTVANENGVSDTTQRQSVMSFAAGSNGVLYITVADKYRNTGATHPGKVTSIYAWDTGSKALGILINGAAVDRVAYQCELFTVLGTPYLFVGDFIGKPDVSPTWQISAWPASGGPGLTDFSNTDAEQDGVTTMTAFNGRLFAGTRVNSAAPQKPHLLTRGPNVAIGGGSNWVGLSGVQALLPDVSSSNLSHYTSMAVLNGVLYVAYFDFHLSKSFIFSLTPVNPGDATSTAFTIATVFSETSSVPILLHTDNAVLYACKTEGEAGASNLMKTTDGSSWSGWTALPTFANGSASLFGIFFGMNQT